jgi:hypothetical protein
LSSVALMDSTINFDAPLSLLFGVTPRFAERAAPAAFCCAADVAGMSGCSLLCDRVLRNRSRVGIIGLFCCFPWHCFRAFHRIRSLGETNMCRLFLVSRLWHWHRFYFRSFHCIRSMREANICWSFLVSHAKPLICAHRKAPSLEEALSVTARKRSRWRPWSAWPRRRNDLCPSHWLSVNAAGSPQ